MKIHEYQGKEIFARYGIPIPKGYPARTAEEAQAAAEKLLAETKGTGRTGAARGGTASCQGTEYLLKASPQGERVHPSPEAT